MFATTVAVQMTLKTRLRNGSHGEVAGSTAPGPDFFASTAATRLRSGGRSSPVFRTAHHERRARGPRSGGFAGSPEIGSCASPDVLVALFSFMAHLESRWPNRRSCLVRLGA